MEQVMIYGANGYTGRLITQRAYELGWKPVLCGRNESAISALAAEKNFPYRIANLENEQQLLKALENIRVVIHAAGPFSKTAKPMIRACLKSGTHYTDITGEIEVFELARSFHQQAIDKNIVLVPGTGFDVVPTDCLSLYLKKRLPNASVLQIAFTNTRGSLSHGTATTMVSNLGGSGLERKEGQLSPVPIGKHQMIVPFRGGNRFVMSIPWGDVSTAFYTTGIPNIITYTGVSKSVYKVLKFQKAFNWILSSRWFRKLAQRQVDKKIPAGPNADQRSGSGTMVWARVENAKGEKCEAELTGPDGYTMTAETSLLIAGKILAGINASGFYTPAGLFGENLIMEVPGIERNDI